MDWEFVDDAKHIRAIRRGKTRAFEEIYRTYKTRVYRYACAVSGNSSDAEDLLQEAFLGLLRNIDRIDERRPVLPYLLQSVRHRHVDRLRSFSHRHQVSVDAEQLPVSFNEESELVERQEGAALVSAALAALPDGQGEVVRLKFYGELGYDGIAAQLAVPAATVRSRYRAAIQKLRNLLGRSVRDV